MPNLYIVYFVLTADKMLYSNVLNSIESRFNKDCVHVSFVSVSPTLRGSHFSPPVTQKLQKFTYCIYVEIEYERFHFFSKHYCINSPIAIL